MNAVLQDLPAFGAPGFVCREPRWLSAIKRGLLLLSAFSLVYVTISVPAIPWPLTLLLWVAAAAMVAILFHPEFGPVRYASDTNGLYLPSSRKFWIPGAATPSTWLFVPWCSVSGIWVQSLADEFGHVNGVVFCLRASEEERQAYFFEASGLPLDDRPFPGDQKFVVARFRCGLRSPYKIAALLHDLWRPHATRDMGSQRSLSQYKDE